MYYKHISILVLSFFFLLSCSSQNELDWQHEEGYRWAELKPGFWGNTGFKQLSARRTNIDFRNDVPDDIVAENRHYLNGSGVAVGDINGNGLVDIYFASLRGPNRLYKNLGNYRFEEITDEAGVAHDDFNSTGVVFADVNGNGHLDLIVSSLSDGNALYLNDGTGKFELKENSGLGASNGSHTLAVADINGNGLLDIYVTNYKIRTARDMYSAIELSFENTMEMQNGELVIRPPFDKDFVLVETEVETFRNEIGEPDELYINLGNGEFELADPMEYFFDEQGEPRGLTPDWGLTSTFRDVTGNGLPDLYVANDFWTPDRFWINQGNGTFRLISREAIRNMSFSSMGVDFSDINRNGYLDFVITEMLSQEHSRRLQQSSEYLPEFEGRTMYSRNSVYLNRGDITFAQIAWYSGLEASEWSWATYFLDVNLNGYEDLIVATGFGRDYQDMDTQIAMYQQDMGMARGGGDILDYPVLNLPNRIFMNNGDLTFTDVSRDWGFDVEDMSLGMALADLNNDGDMDIIINRLNEEAAIYENRTNAPRIAVRLNGESPNTYGVGAKIYLTGGHVDQSKEITAGGNYLSGPQAQVVFAADENISGHTLEVHWPGGRKSVVEGVQANRMYEIEESYAHENNRLETEAAEKEATWFEEASDLLDHTHHENEYDDFRFSPLLPLKQSKLGPGVAFLDVTQNGIDDLLIGTGREGELALFQNHGDGIIEQTRLVPLTDEAPGDQTAVIGWREGDESVIVVGSANYEQGNPNVPSAFIYRIDPDREVRTEEIPGILSTTGPVTAVDYTGNGYPDLFIGGRHVPGRYPVDADSRMFRNENGSFVFDETNSRLLTGAGLVTDALFADFTQNGRQDLLISTEWGSLQLFENRDGVFADVTSEMGLSNYKGWWNGLATGDFTNNGLPDIVALNIGLNSAYQLTDGQPLRMYYDDFNWDGRMNILEAYYSNEIGGYVPRRRLHDFESIPTILANVRTHREFAESTVDQIFGRDFSEVPYKEINTLEHMIFLNTGSGFESRPLPREAQFSSAYFAGVADFDNDGHEDLFISQNFFAFPQVTSRLDAGRGLILKGDGAGSFTSVPGQESGIKVYGEQRGAGLFDLNGNGRTDIVVTQNSQETRLFLNRAQNQGLRIQLKGPPENMNATGSFIRLVYPDGSKGPARYLQTGGGYLSQNSYTQVLGFTKFPAEIEVTWFDGRVTTSEVSEGQYDYLISF